MFGPWPPVGHEGSACGLQEIIYFKKINKTISKTYQNEYSKAMGFRLQVIRHLLDLFGPEHILYLTIVGVMI